MKCGHLITLVWIYILADEPTGNLDSKSTEEIIDSTTALQHVANLDIINGRYLSESEVEKGDLVAVIGGSDAIRIFGSTDLSVRVTVGSVSRDVKIVSVKAVDDRAFVGTAANDRLVTFEMPYTTMSAFNDYTESFENIYNIAQSNEYTIEVAQKAME